MKIKALLLAAAAARRGGGAPAQAQTLRWAAQNDILTLDPHSQNHATTNAILMHAYEGLTRYNAKYKIEPALATKWTFVSPTQVRFELRRGVKFHDGSPFTADDVVFSFGRIKQPQGTMQIYVTGINEIKKVDDHTVDFILAAPEPAAAAQHRRLPHHEQGVVGEEQHRQRPGLQGQGGELRLAQRDGHRPVQDHRLDARAARHDDRQHRLVGQARGQRQRR